MNHKRLVSIIIPAYNAEAYIKEAIDSALAQTYDAYEVIVVDDGSTDGTKKAIDGYIKNRSIRYVYQDNKGLAGARNAGIRAARGDYIAFLDSDDIFLENKIAEQIAVLEKEPSFGICYSDLLHFIDSNPRRFYHHRYRYPSGDIFEPLLKKQFINPLTVMVRREIFERYGYFDEGLRRSEDWDLWLRWARLGVKFYYLDKALAHYRVRPFGNLSALESEPDMKERNYFLFRRLGEQLTSEERARYGFDSILRRLEFKTLFAYLMTGKKKEALLYQKSHLLPSWVGLFVALLPGIVWQIFLVALRRIKHRLLLKKFVKYSP